MTRAIYSLILSTSLALVLLGGRLYLSGDETFLFLSWNLFLAWVPYGISLGVESLRRYTPERWISIALLGVAWFLFFPNAPYLITDFVHLESRPPIPLWYDVGLLAVFAWSGLFLGVFSLRNLQRTVRHYFGLSISWLFAMSAMGASGLGLYIGRYLRWNSWDLIVRPCEVLRDLATRLVHPLDHLSMFGVTFLFGGLMFICYLTIVEASDQHTVS